MIEFISNYIADIVIILVLVTIAALIIVSSIRNRKKGKSSCSSGCANCPMSGKCH